MERKEKDPLSSTLHAPDEPTGDRLPVEPEMQKGELEPSGERSSPAPRDKSREPRAPDGR